MIFESRVTSMLPPQTRTAVRWPLRVVFFWSRAARAAAPAPSARSLLALEQDEDGAGDFLFVDGDELVDILRNQREGAVAGAADGDAIGDGGLGGDGDRVAGLAGSQHRGEALGLDADDAGFWMALLDGAGDTADEPAAADGDDDGFEVGDLVE